MKVNIFPLILAIIKFLDELDIIVYQYYLNHHCYYCNYIIIIPFENKHACPEFNIYLSEVRRESWTLINHEEKYSHTNKL